MTSSAKTNLTSLRGYSNPFPRGTLKRILCQNLQCRIPPATLVMIAKLLELLLIDIIEKMERQGRSRRTNTLFETHLKRIVNNHPYLNFLSPFLANVEDIEKTPEPDASYSVHSVDDSETNFGKPSPSRKKRTQSTQEPSQNQTQNEKKFKSNSSSNSNDLALSNNLLELLKEVDLIAEYQKGLYAATPHERTDLIEILKPRLLERDWSSLNSNLNQDDSKNPDEFSCESSDTTHVTDYPSAERLIWTRPESERQWMETLVTNLNKSNTKTKTKKADVSSSISSSTTDSTIIKNKD